MTRILLSLAFVGVSGCSEQGPPDFTPEVGCVLQESSPPSEGWAHMTEDSQAVYASNPPASGPHYPRWARYSAYTTPIPRGYWLHNLEHGAVAILYRPDAPSSVVDALMDVYASVPDDSLCGAKRLVLTPDPELEAGVAATAAYHVLTGSCVNRQQLREFVVARRNNGPENRCEDGTFPP